MIRASQPSILDDLQVLIWRDVRVLRNSATRIYQEPLRLIGWILWLVYIVYFFFFRRGASSYFREGALIATDVAAAIFLLVMSLSFLRGESPPVPFFESSTEARFITTARVRPWIVTVYFQLRNALKRFPSMAFFLAYILTLSPPPQHGPLVIVSITTVLGIMLLSRVYSLPREFSSGLLRLLFTILGVVMVGVALVSGFCAVAAILPGGIPGLQRLPILHLGYAFLLGSQGNLATAIWVDGLVIFAFYLGVLTTKNKYPELYELSLAGWEFRQRFREGNHREQRRQLRALLDPPTANPALRGAAIGLWLNWLLYRRSVPLWWICTRPFFAFGAGYAIVALTHDLLEVIKAFGIIIVITLITTAVTDATRIGKELRQPLFWLTDQPFSSRLRTIVFAWYWRSAGDVLLFFAGTLSAGGAPSLIAECTAVILSGVWLQRCISTVAFAILPSSADLGGPVFLTRMIVTAALSIPPGVAGVMTATLQQNIGSGLLVGCLCALAESVLVLVFAARRLNGRYDRILGY